MDAVPPILIRDYNQDPPLTTIYVHGHNEINTRNVYTAIKDLDAHRGLGKRDSEGTLHECSEAFIGDFFRCCASLIDYFADFAHLDGSHMHELWFHLVDTVQDVAASLPHAISSSANDSRCTHAESFSRAYEDVILLVNRAIQGRLSPALLDGALVHRGESIFEPASYTAESFRAGLKNWQQFLLNDSPGCDGPVAGRGVAAIERGVCERRVPMGALVLIHRHAEVLRHVAEDYAASGERMDSGDTMRDFDLHCSSLQRTRTYTSLSGHPTVARPTYPLVDTGAEPRLARQNDIADPELACPEPNLWMLNEAAGDYQGETPVQLPQGNDRFWLLDVKSLSKPRATAPGPRTTERQALDDLFDDWSF